MPQTSAKTAVMPEALQVVAASRQTAVSRQSTLSLYNLKTSSTLTYFMNPSFDFTYHPTLHFDCTGTHTGTGV